MVYQWATLKQEFSRWWQDRCDLLARGCISAALSV